MNEQVLFREVGRGLHQNENNAFLVVLSVIVPILPQMSVSVFCEGKPISTLTR